MNYLEFKNRLLPFQIFSTSDIRKVFPSFDSRRLVEWSKKGYLKKIVNKWYIFAEIEIDEMLRMRISNCIYQPSYVSLSTALSFYGLIPEGVFTCQAISSLKTNFFDTSVGTFEYRSLQPSLFFGYTILKKGALPVLIAEKEKALLDFCYLTPTLKSQEDIYSLRLNLPVLQDFNWDKISDYALHYKSKVLNNRISWIKQNFQNGIAV